MRTENKEIVKEGLAGAGAVLLIVLLCLVPMSFIFSWIVGLVYVFSYWISQDNWVFMFYSILVFAPISAYLVYPMIKEEVDKR